MWSSLVAPFLLAFYWGYGFFHIPGVDSHAKHLERRRRHFILLCRDVHLCDVESARLCRQPSDPATALRGVQVCADCGTPWLVYATLLTRRIGVRCRRCCDLLVAVRDIIFEKGLSL